MHPGIIAAIVSALIMLVGVNLFQRGSHLRQKGKKTRAVIFKNNYKRSGDSGGLYYPVVRFTTETREWITQELNIGYLPEKPEGTRLEVVYDPEEPTHVEINSWVQLKILPLLFIASGAIGFILSALDYAEVIKIFSEK